MSFKFEKLEIWKRSLDLTIRVDEVVKLFPDDERFVLSSQMKRAADSVSLNIAEGSTGQSDKEFNRFLGIALRSGIEVVGCLYIAKGRKLISEEKFNVMYEKLLSMTKMIQSFRKSLKVEKINGRKPKTDN